MSFVERHPYISLGVLLLLWCVVQSMDYRDQVAAEQRASVVKTDPHNTRLPDVGTEYRICFERRTAPDRLKRSCHIAPIDPQESPGETMRRLLARERKST